MFRPLHALILLLFSTGAFAQTTIIYTAQYMGGFHGGQARPKMQYCTSPHCSDDRGVPIDESTWTAVLR